MAVLEIHKAGDPVLKKVCEPVKRIDKKVKRILKDMAETLYKTKNGIGLAAPQVGILQRIVVIDLQDGNGLLELINPVITKKEGSQVVGEGCLSVPNFEGEVGGPYMWNASIRMLPGKSSSLPRKDCLPSVCSMKRIIWTGSCLRTRRLRSR